MSGRAGRQPRRRAAAPSAARRSGGRGATGPLDLHDLLLLGGSDPIDLADPAVGRLLEVVELTVRLVGPDRSVALFLFELVGRVAAQVADLDLSFLHPPMDALDE